MSQSTSSYEPIAIIGSSCRFPGASTSPSKLWDLLSQPRDIRDSTRDDLNLRRFYNKSGDVHGATDVKTPGYLLEEDSRLFDASFFGISPYEAETMDPQQRILLETAYEALESAGYSLERIRGTQTSVHIGSMTGDYHEIQVRDLETVPQYAATGSSTSILSNRISYVFDLHGPSMTIDTACSSSLVALHSAIQSIHAGDCSTALVGGVNLIFDAGLYIIESKLHMLSPDAQSRMWDKTANGYARGEGAGMVFLKPLFQAIKDNDHIEGVIRATGVNSDGQSPGITMPTSAAQATLIRDTYRRAGLDPVKDRCQYFECHGTGTKAGDPVEARAIFEALFDSENVSEASTGEQNTEPLYVGSIKTVTGHLEGCAGLAGVLKALLSIKHKTILPNLLFNELNPAIEPYYGKIQIPITPKAWPQVAAGLPLRVSVNSFGFGGTNAHVILESFGTTEEDRSTTSDAIETQNGQLVGPLVLSAHSGPALLGNVQALLRYVINTPAVDLADLSWVMQTRRTTHRYKTYFSSETRDGLIRSMESFVMEQQKSSQKDSVGIRHQYVNPSEVPGVLGVFTGQGAQWPTMGRGLLHKSPLFRHVLEQCDAALHALADGPEWSLIEELSKEASTSHVGEAAISQPLCTAIQLALVEVLYAAGVHFDAVVGHSSGEISAVYACGIITLPAAMQIAYYRGKYAYLARGNDDKAGAMMAVGINYNDAKVFCQQPEYNQRIGVAASNGPSSVTLSGDADAIQSAKEHFDSQNVFARLLKVDTAYHSYHMENCAAAYLNALTACNIQITKPRDGCFWNSSVRGDTELLRGNLSSLKGTYWVQNMVQTVLFSHALRSSIWHGGPFDLAIEIGPHPALKGPVEQTLQSAFGMTPSYTGVLQRGGSDYEALTDGMGYIWAHLGSSFINFDGMRKAFLSHTSNAPQVLKDLPTYSWDHDRVYWRESRVSMRYRKGADTSQELLGRRMPDDNDRELRWRNVLKLSELPWVKGHEILGEPLLPGASYISLALEAGRRIAAGKDVRLIEVQDVEIRRPVVVPDSREGHETIFSVRLIDSNDVKTITGDFSYYYCSDERVGSMVHTANGRLVIHLGVGTQKELPACGAQPHDLLPVDPEDGYSVTDEAGMLYSGIFRRLGDIQRKLDYATASAKWTTSELGDDEYVVHPAILDVCFQSLFHARADPTAGKLPVSLLPVHLKRVVVNPNVSMGAENGTIKSGFQSFITVRNGLSLSGDVHVYDPTSGESALQVEGLTVQPVSPLTEAQDRNIFSESVFKVDPLLCHIEPAHDLDDVARDRELAADADRMAIYYMQRILEKIQPNEMSGIAWYHQRMLESFKHWLQIVRGGLHPLASPSWLDDRYEVLEEIFAKYPGRIDVIAIRAVGENLVNVIRGKISMLEVLMKDDKLTRFYTEACGFPVVSKSIVNIIQQISHKFPLANYLEIGAGTGSATSIIFETMGKSYGTYTYTDISPGFFENAAHRFPDHTSKMIFKTLDCERDVASQGYEENSYDVIVASNVLHATANMANTLSNVRSLLKPGGFLVLIEITGMEILRIGFVMGGLQGWWLGSDDGRKYSPCMPTEEWDRRLQQAGFSGVDLVFHDLPYEDEHCLSFMVSQAVNDTVSQLRAPLDFIGELPSMDPLLIIGGKSLAVSKMVTSLSRLAAPQWQRKVTTAHDIESIDFSRLYSGTDVICLQELDSPLFSSLTSQKKFKALQTILMRARNVLWVTKDRRAKNPRANMFAGMARAINKELPDVNIQSLDLSSIDSPSEAARTVLSTFLRQKIYSNHQHDDGLLWIQEPELVCEGSDILIPRIILNKEINGRYNAANRTVTRKVDCSDVSVRLVRQQKRLSLIEANAQGRSNSSESSESSSVKVNFSVLLSSNEEQDVYLSVGHVASSASPVLAISQVNASIVDVPQQNLIEIENSHCNPSFLQTAGDYIVAESILSSTSSDKTALIYEPRESLAAVIVAVAQRHGIKATFASSNSSVPEGWVRLHPQSSVHAIRRAIPFNISAYIDCSTASDPLRVTIRGAIPSTSSVHEFSSQLLQKGLSVHSTNAYLLAAYNSFKTDALPFTTEIDVLDIKSLSNMNTSSAEVSQVVSWQTSGTLDLVVQPPNFDTIFDSNKTYLMIGMAGGLGLSLCEWALKCGVKHLVITSRNPKIHPEWLSQAERMGANVYVRSMDVSDKASIESVVQDIRTNLPPIGGVCNSAMVLSDALFMDMDADGMNAPLMPKVEGSKHLNDIFADDQLDFFVLLSSCAMIIGTEGQANYHAANQFMTALAHQRRQKGLAASVIHIGFVADVGYTTRQNRSIKEMYSRMQIKFISEKDVHHAFAEAVISGKPNSHRLCEVTIGLSNIDRTLSLDERPGWLQDPRFGHLLPATLVRDDEEVSSGQENIKETIAEVETEAEALDIVQTAFSTKLETIMQLPVGSVNVDLSLVELGIDSLVAVEIRTWFLKELGTDVAVLKILGGDSVNQICTNAAKQVLAKRLAGPTKRSSDRSQASSDTASVSAESLSGRDRSSSSSGQASSASSDICISDIPDLKTPMVDVIEIPTEKESLVSIVEILASEGSQDISVGAPSDSEVWSNANELAQDITHTEKMSVGQSRIYVLSKHLEDPTAYNLMFQFDMEGLLDVERLRYALSATMQHHECLRTCFYARSEDNQPMQGVLATPIRQFKHITDATEEDIESEVKLAKTRVWNIERGETMALTILSQNDHKHSWILSYHHIVMDTAGWRVFLQDLASAYRMQPLKHKAGTYLEYTRKQLAIQPSSQFESQFRYWKEEFSTIPDVIPLLPITKVRARPRTPQPGSSSTYRRLGENLATAIKNASKALRITPFHFHLAVFQVLFAQSLGIEDICIGMADANRSEERFAETVGFFMNLLPIRFQVSKNAGFAEIAKNTSRKVLAALENSAVPFDMILDSLNVPRSSSHTPLFQVAINYRLGVTTEMPFANHTLEIVKNQEAKNPYDISISIIELHSGGTVVELISQASLYEQNTTEVILDSYLRLAEFLTKNLNIALRDCQVGSHEDVTRASQLGQGRQVEFDWSNTLSERFDAIQQKYPEKTAITYGTSSLTYAQLAAKVNSIATALQAHGCAQGDRVAILCKPSIDFTASMLAILHIGAVYVPLDVTLPSTRHKVILENCSPKILLSHQQTATAADGLVSASEISFNCFKVDKVIDSNNQASCMAQANSPAVLLYTSGSTGKPKGVVLSQSNFRNHIALKTEELRLQEGTEVILQQSSLGFDMSLIQTFCALCTGGNLIVVPQESRRDPVEVTQLIRRHDVSLTIATPSEYLMWLRYGDDLKQCSAWRWACMGGEPVHSQIKREFKRLNLQNLSFLNCYGPTEITAAATFHQFSLDSDAEAESQTVVGKAIPNYSIRIANVNGHTLPIGHRGEVCIGGAGVASGYWELPVQTEAKFFMENAGAGTQKRWYKTGDQGYLLEDGSLVLLGRLEGDTQVKLRGLRIELEEVEGALRKAGQSCLSNVVVVVRDNALVAYATPISGTEIDQDTIRGLLAELPLPQYMCPGQLIMVDDLPTTSNGKIDRQAVKELSTSATKDSTSSQQKLSLREGELRILWEKVLPVANSALTPASDFFLEGGNSLRLIKLQRAIKEAMGVSISTNELYLASNLRAMAARVGSQRIQQVPENEKIDWTRETAVSDTLIAEAKNASKQKRTQKTKGFEVLLTGATSFLGATVLQKLLEDQTVSNIHCVAILPDEEDKLPDSKKVIRYTGILSSPTLGLSPAECDDLQDRMDVVIHAGASGHCLNNYSSVRLPNVHSTRFLTSLCLPRSTPLLYVSSNRVSLLSGSTTPRPVSVALSPPPTTGSEGFTASKWASETFLQNMSSHAKSLPVQIHRPCVVVGDQAPNSDALNAILRYATSLKSIPRFRKMDGYFDFKKVEDVASDLVSSALSMASSPANGVTFRHHSSGVKVPMNSMAQHMHHTYGGDFEEMDILDWLAKATDAGMDPLITTYLESLVEKDETLRFPYLGES